MAKLIIFLAVIVIAIATAAVVKEVEVQITLIPVTGWRTYHIDVNGQRVTPSAKCTDDATDEVDVVGNTQCYVHCLLMGKTKGKCKKSRSPCICEGTGKNGSKVYQDHVNKCKLVIKKIKDKKREEREDQKKYQLRPQKNPEKEKKPTKDDARGSGKDKDRGNAGKEKIPGTNIIEVFTSNEERWADPPYTSEESRELYG